MITWILIILDLISFIFLSLIHNGYDLSFRLILMPVVYLIGKAVAFRDVMSYIDAFWGIYILVAWAFGLSTFIYYLILIWFGYKLISTIISF